VGRARLRAWWGDSPWGFKSPLRHGTDQQRQEEAPEAAWPPGLSIPVRFPWELPSRTNRRPCRVVAYASDGCAASARAPLATTGRGCLVPEISRAAGSRRSRGGTASETGRLQ